MADDQMSESEHWPLVGHAPSPLRTLSSRLGPKPEPPSLASLTLEAAHERKTWPVPHVMVYYGDIEYAYGRRAIADMGQTAFLEWTYRRHVWTPKATYGIEENYRTTYFERSRFAKEARVLGTFYHMHGASDMGPVYLSALGWAEMIQNVVKLEVVYDEDSDEEDQPGKQG